MRSLKILFAMLEQQISISFFLAKFRPNAENKCLIKMNVYCKPQKRRYTTTYHCTEEEWEKINNTNLRDNNLKEIKNKLNAFKLRAEKIASKIKPFSFLAFEETFLGNIRHIKGMRALVEIPKEVSLGSKHIQNRIYHVGRVGSFVKIWIYQITGFTSSIL